MSIYEELTDEEKSLLKKHYQSPPLDDWIRYPNGPVIMPRSYLAIADRISNFQFRDDDILIVTYPKSGTTWTQEMVWQIVNNVDINQGKIPLFARTPFLEMGCILGDNDLFGAPPPEMPQNIVEMFNQFKKDPISYTENFSGRRVIKTHVPMEMLPKNVVEKCKVIYVARNMKDMAVSWYHHLSNITPHDYRGSFEDFLSLFEKDLHMYGSYFHHVLGGWSFKGHPNFRFVWFEDMKKDIKKEVMDTCTFIDVNLTDDKIEQLLDHIEFKNIKKNMAVNIPKSENVRGDFVRKGEVGDYKNHLDENKIIQWNNWIQEMTKNSTIVMPEI